MINVAHELRTPLTNMQGYLEALIDGVVPHPRKPLNCSMRKPCAWSTWWKTFSAWRKQMPRGLTFIKSRSGLTDLIAQLLELLSAPNSMTKKISVETAVASKEIGRLQADPDKLSQVIHNLLAKCLAVYSIGWNFVRISIELMPAEIKVVFANTGGELSGRRSSLYL